MPVGPRLAKGYGRLPLAFERNDGQTDDEVKYLARGRRYALFLAGDEAVLSLRQSSAVSGQPSAQSAQSPRTTDNGPRTSGAFFLSFLQNPGSQIQNGLSRTPKPELRSPSVVRLKLLGANPHAKVSGLDELPGKSNYFIGNDPSKWRRNVPNYAKVRYQDVYPGIDLVYYGNQRQLEHDFIVSPGASPGSIRLGIEGTEKTSIDAHGNLVAGIQGGEVVLNRPIIYQESASDGGSKAPNRKSVDGHYVLVATNQVAFEVGQYDRNLPLIIDPVLTYSTYLGGSDYDFPEWMAADSAGNAYVVGLTRSLDFPVSGSFQTGPLGGGDGFLTKINPDGTEFVYSTYFGGTGFDIINGVAVDTSGNVYMTGNTQSSDFPITSGVVKSTLTGANAFVTKLDSTGANLVFSTFLGGTFAFGNVGFGQDIATGIAIDSSTNVYVMGYTWSTDFPVTAGAFDSTCGIDGQCDNQNDMFVSKLDPSASTLLYSTYFGGSGAEYPFGKTIAADSSGKIYIVTWVDTGDLPTTANAYDATCGSDGSCNGTYDAFFAEFDSAQAGAASLVYSTYLGGADFELGTGITLDSSGGVYIVGGTASADFPVTPDALQATKRGDVCGIDPNTGPCGDGFIVRIDPTLTGAASLTYSTFIGGTENDDVSGIALDSAENIYITGSTQSADFPLASPIQETYGGGTCNSDGFTFRCPDVYVMKLNAAASGVIFSTYLGGGGQDVPYGVAVDGSGNALVAGLPSRTGFPTTSGALQTSSTDACAPFPEGYVPFTQVYYIAHPFTGDNLLVGQMTQETYSTLQSLPPPALVNQKFCERPELALVGPSITGAPYFAIPYVPTAAERSGDFSYFDGQLTDPADGTPFTGNIIPPDRIPDVFAWRLSTYLGSGDAFAAKFSGLALPVPLPVPATVAFSDSGVGFASSPQTVVVTNVGDADLTISDLTTTTAEFSVVTEGTTCSGSDPLEPNTGCVVKVGFTPAVVGERTGELHVASDAYGSPLVVPLSGTGLAAPALTLSAETLAFGNVRTATTSDPRTVTVTNSGSAPLHFTLISASGEFDIASAGTTCSVGTPVAASGSCTIAVTFSPTATGAQVESLSITDDAPGSPHSVALTGTGADPVIEPASGASDTATVTAGGSASYDLVFTPVGVSGNTTFSCSGAPQHATCTVSPSSANLDGSTPVDLTVDVTTTARSMLAPPVGSEPRTPGGQPEFPLTLVLWTLLVIALAALAGKLGERRGRIRTRLALLAVLAVALAWGACGGGGGGTTPAPQGTPAGTYTLTVTATAGGLTESTNLTLTVN